MMSVAMNADTDQPSIPKLNGMLEPAIEDSTKCSKTEPSSPSNSKRMFESSTLSNDGSATEEENNNDESKQQKQELITQPTPTITTTEPNNQTPETTSKSTTTTTPTPTTTMTKPEQESLIMDDDETDDKSSSPGNSNLGRRGDPRMHRAVAARLASPEMSLLDALISGGFEFPDGTEGAGKSDRNVYDSENVLLCQRKNQLSRRLRLARKGAVTRFNDPAMRNLENVRGGVGGGGGGGGGGGNHDLYNGNAGLLSNPFWGNASSSLPGMMNGGGGGVGMGNPRLGGHNGHVSSRAQGLMQMVLANQSSRQSSQQQTDNDLLEARAAILAQQQNGVVGSKHALTQYKNYGLTSPERKKLRQEQELQSMYMPDALSSGGGGLPPSFYGQHGGLHGGGQGLPQPNGLMGGQAAAMQNLQFQNRFHPSLMQNNVMAADLAIHAANKEQNGIDRYYLDLAAASMGMGKEKIQSIIANSNGSASSSSIHPASKYPSPHEGVMVESSGANNPNIGPNGTNMPKAEFGSRAQESQIDIAVKFYKTERALLVQRCLLMAGFDQSEVMDDGVLCDLFEKKIGK